MSYDVSVSIDTGNGESLEEEIGNYTYNCSAMLTKALVAVGKEQISLSDMHGWDVSKVAFYLKDALQYMRENRKEFIAMNPDNGWGDFESWLEFLSKIYETCLKHPKCDLRIR
jgi:hypothetical protein